MRIDTNDLISVTNANKAGISRLVNDAAEGRTIGILRNSEVAAFIIGPEQAARLSHIDEIEEDLRMWAAALIRVATDSGRRHDLDDVLAELEIELD